MPYFDVKTTTSLNAETKENLYHELARIIELVPGKSESWVMVNLADQAQMCFAGISAEPAAAVVLKTFGELEGQYYDLLTKEICSRISPMIGVQPDRLYVTYEPITHWGWNGENF